MSYNEGRGYLWRRCPYSLQSTAYGDTRIPELEKTDHVLFDGKMCAAGRGSIVGFECQDPACSYFTGTATTTIDKVYLVSCTTLVTGTINIIPNTYFFER